MKNWHKRREGLEVIHPHIPQRAPTQCSLSEYAPSTDTWRIYVDVNHKHLRTTFYGILNSSRFHSTGFQILRVFILRGFTHSTRYCGELGMQLEHREGAEVDSQHPTPPVFAHPSPPPREPLSNKKCPVFPRPATLCLFVGPRPLQKVRCIIVCDIGAICQFPAKESARASPPSIKPVKFSPFRSAAAYPAFSRCGYLGAKGTYVQGYALRTVNAFTQAPYAHPST